jgi:putative DNA primase/helicase
MPKTLSQPAAEPPSRPPIVEAIPAELRERPQWIVWRYEDRDGNPTKVLYDPMRRKCRAEANNPLTWASFDDALAAFQAGGFDGIGFVFSKDDPYFGADVDKCLAGGEIASWAAPIIARLEGTYGEVSPRGQGIKFIGKGKISPEARKLLSGKKTGTNRRGLGPDQSGGFEVYDHGRFFALTGNIFGGVATIAELPGVADDLVRLAKDKPPKASSGSRRRPPKSPPAGDELPSLLDPPSGDHSDGDVMGVAELDMTFNDLWAGRHSFGSPSEADLSLCNRLATLCGPGQQEQVRRLFLGSELGKRGKVADRADYLDRTIVKAYEGRTEYYRWAPSANGQANSVHPPNGDAQHPAEPDPLNLTEWGNARRLVATHGTRLRYCKPLSQWYEWDGRRWSPDQSGAIWRWAKDTVRRLGHEAANTEDDRRRQAILRWALKSEEKKVIAAMIELAWSEPGIPIMPDTLDADPWLLNTPSGTLDLTTGRLRPHRQDDLISKITGVPFDLGAECPRWEQTVLPEIFSGDREMVAYVKRALGYSLTGVIGEHALFLCHGTGRNGKNTVLDTVHSILGEYATVVNPRVLLTAGKNDHPAAIADLMGRRFVPTDEVDEGEELAESLVKRLTGNKTLKGRFMRQNPFEFPALFKLWMLANCKPEIHGQDEGIWSRIRVIPFEVFFPPEKRIKGLSDILVAEEGPGILRWMVDGCLEWQRIGLAEPAKVREATQGYRNEQDVIGDFIDQCCESFLDHPTLRDQARVQAGVLYNRYAEWCKQNGEKTVLTNRRFASKITGRGYKLSPSNGVHCRHGITLKTVKSEGSDEKSDDDRPY